MKHFGQNTAVRRGERGNALFYILIAIALLAALTYAIAQSGRGSVQQLSAEKARLLASEVMEYGNAVSGAVAQLRLRGVRLDELSFANDTVGGYGHTPAEPDEHKVFHLNGGGVNIYDIPAEAANGSAVFVFAALNEIENIGTTCGAAACSELLMSAQNLKKELCAAINDRLGISNPGGNPPDVTSFDEGSVKFTGEGSIGYSQTVGDEASDAGLSGKTAGCFRELPANCGGNADCYTYYRVLWSR